MRAVTHSMDNTATAPVGIWWIDSEGVLHRHYLPNADAELSLGAQIMSQRLENIKVEDYFDWLDSQAPFIHDWNAVEVKEPEKFLSTLQKLRATAA